MIESVKRVCPVERAYLDGYEAYMDGESTSTWNPYRNEPGQGFLSDAWDKGWRDASEEYPEL